MIEELNAFVLDFVVFWIVLFTGILLLLLLGVI
jgi:hypothetical protein